jgi:hypothetical protein
VGYGDCAVRSGWVICGQSFPDAARSGQRTETWQTRPRPTVRIKERHPATRHDVGKTVKRSEPKKKARRQTG